MVRSIRSRKPARHTMEGMFADPIYGGNKDFAGWRLVGFPGAQAIFTPNGYAEQASVHPRAHHRFASAGQEVIPGFPVAG